MHRNAKMCSHPVLIVHKTPLNAESTKCGLHPDNHIKCIRASTDLYSDGVRRVLQITELVRDCLQQRDANCTILPAPPETCDLDSTATILQACPIHPLPILA